MGSLGMVYSDQKPFSSLYIYPWLGRLDLILEIGHTKAVAKTCQDYTYTIPQKPQGFVCIGSFYHPRLQKDRFGPNLGLLAYLRFEAGWGRCQGV